MKKSKLFVILTIILAIALIAETTYLIITKLNKNEDDIINEEVTYDYAVVQEDGTKLNVSVALAEPKVIDELEFSNITVQEKDNLTTVFADVYNPTNVEKGGFETIVKMYDESGNILGEFKGYINVVQPNATTRFSSSVTGSYADSYNFLIEKSE